MNKSNLSLRYLVALLLAGLLAACGPTEFEKGLTAFEAGAFADAYEQWHVAAMDNDASAQNGIGWMLENGLKGPPDPGAAAIWYDKAAEQGHDGAMLNLGNLYDNGIGVTKDYKIAAQLFEDAAYLGNAEAQNNLGRMYQNGQGVEKDQEKAVEWLERAAQQGYAPAQNSLGLHYFRGLGVKQDAEKALFWLELATLIGQEGAELNRDFVQTFVEPGKVEEIKTEALRWHPRTE